MIKIKKAWKGLAYEYFWFAQRPKLSRALRPVLYAQSKYREPCFGYVRRRFITRIVDLRRSEASIFDSLRGQTKSDVKRALREAIDVRPIADLSQFVDFYNAFAPLNRQPKVRPPEFANWGRDTVALGAFIDGAPVAMHSYLVDRTEWRARALHSVSIIHALRNGKKRNEVGRANRLLHFQAMLYFKGQGMEKYDVGGVPREAKDRKLRSIAEFKSTLGGEEQVEYHYVSIPLYVLQSLWCRMRHLVVGIR